MKRRTRRRVVRRLVSRGPRRKHRQVRWRRGPVYRRAMRLGSR